MTNISKQYSFGHWRFDAATGDLSDGHSVIRLEPQVGKLLAYFLEHQGTVISRAELIEAVWENRVVSDDAINRCISILRQTLSPGDTHAYIETVTRRGYVAHFPENRENGQTENRPSALRKFWLALPVLAVMAIAGFVYFSRGIDVRVEQSRAEHAGPPVVAVLPFTAFGEDPDGELFAHGVHDDLLTQLAQLQALRVISRTSVAEYRDSNRNIREIGTELGANAIVEGSVQSADDKIRINVQLIDVASDEHLWAQTYDRALTPESLFTVQSEIARAISTAMHTELTTEDAAQLAVLPTQNMAAYRAYHHAMEIRDTRGLHDPAYIEGLEQAVTLDPEFIRAWAELAGFLSLKNFGQSDAEAIVRNEVILDKIRTMAPDSAEYLIAQAYYTYYVVKNYELAYELVSRAQQLRPSDVRVVEVKSYIERRLGDFDGRVKTLRLAQALDPRNPHWTHITVLTLVVAHRYEEAIEEIDTSGFETYRLAAWRSVLDVQHHRDFQRWQTEMESLQKEFGDTANPLDLWDAMIANRDIHSAQALQQSMPKEITISWGGVLNLISVHDQRGLLNAWFLKDVKAIQEYSSVLEDALRQTSTSDSTGEIRDAILVEALLNSIRGNTAETGRLIRGWERATSTDLAELTNTRHFACRILGMAAATKAAVECLRSSFEAPSYAMPFIEPFLPYYDPIRNEPEFIRHFSE